MRGRERVCQAVRALLKFAGRVDTERCGEPAALTATLLVEASSPLMATATVTVSVNE